MTEFVEGNRLTLLESGRAYFPALEAACDAALTEIHVETYIFEEDDAGQRIAAALERAARRGVATHVLVDGFGSKRMSDALQRRLGDAGVKLLVYRPELASLRFQRQRLRRLHRKLAVIDARLGFVGGINIIDDMHTPGHTPPRFDYAVQVEGPLVEQIHSAAKRLWTIVLLTQLGGGWPDDEGPDADVRPKGTQAAAFLVRDNLWHRNDIEEAYLEAIARARSEILIASSYFFPGLSFRHALAEAAARGVRVLLLLQGRVEYRLLHYASRALYGSLLDSGVEIHEYHKSFLHAKVAVVDRVWATVGSSNIDPFSLLLAREANVVVMDERFATELRESLGNALEEGAKQVQPERWHRRPLLHRLAHWGCYGFARLLTGLFAYGQGQEFSS
ncbi:MAG TPA: cardiolipin synthase ClsB [Burkholderiales bacterium]|nr:cardiolipin synthase ClsB [Burkholderiales bacterium]